ncbi:mucin-17-like isoform X1 [Athalia rosae]|uniref:mucin-17-like isoform X1 n=1 Tax=Athalia rosae TaxID=37344 RepID=UPI002033C5D8|nr:mucin-17-like isoform X1 [Athalia rosae]
MEIPKSLQEEIHSVQNKLKNAIQNHQVYVGKLNNDPNNEELLGQIHEIQEHIVSLSKCQKQVVQRLRKEVKLFEAANSNGTKVSIPSLLGLNNNDNINNNNETKTKDSEQTVDRKNLNGLNRRRSTKDDYEDGIQSVDSPSPNEDCQNNCAKARPDSDESESNDVDVMEISVDENRNPEKFGEIQEFEQTNFLGSLGLITSDTHTELQNKRAERKRRSTANPQFIYSNWEIPTKRKKHSYLQSNGTAPQTRQTTARLNGPSPPPNKVSGSKPSTTPSRIPIKSLIPTQKSSTRPNILRNNPESKVFPGKIKSEDGSTQGPSAKGGHIPGLPSTLTIERIRNETVAVCIHCRNPGSLLVCKICSASYHVPCNIVPSAPPRTCGKCIVQPRERDRDRDSSNTTPVDHRGDNKIATASKSSGTTGQTRKDSKVHQTAGGFYKVNATEERSIPTTVGINQLPTSTFLIPIATNSVPTISASSVTSTVHNSQPGSVTSSSVSLIRQPDSSTCYSPILINQFVQPGRDNSDATVSYTYQLPISTSAQQNPSQSYFILGTVPESSGSSNRKSSGLLSTVVGDFGNSSAVFEYQQRSTTGYNNHDQSEIKAIPALTHISNNSTFVRRSGEQVKHNGELCGPAENAPAKSDQSKSSKNIDRDKCVGVSLTKFSVNQLRNSQKSDNFIPIQSVINESETVDQLPPDSSGKGGKWKSKTNLLYSLFSSNNESHSIPSCSVQSKNRNSEQDQPKFDQPTKNDEQKFEPTDQPKPRLRHRSSSSSSEYVKLEEAHLPAPLRPNIIRKSVDKITAIPETLQNLAPGGVTSKEINNTHYEDRNITSSGVEGSEVSEAGKVRNNSDFTSFEDYHNENLKATLDFIAIERQHSSNYIKFHDFDDLEAVEDSSEMHSRVLQQDRMVAMPSGMTELLKNNLPISRNKLLPLEIKAEFERQDLPINGFEPIENASENGNQETTLPIEIIRSSRGEKPKVGMNTVSTENMLVLEQFESAMLQADGDETANC